MQVVIAHTTSMVSRKDLGDAAQRGVPEDRAGPQAPLWINQDLTEVERSNLRVLEGFWNCWKTLPFDVDRLREFFAPDVVVRTGWRGEHVVEGREEALAMYAMEAQRQAEHGEVTDFRFPVVIAKGPIVFHSWVWIARSERLGYHIERPMAASYLITDGKIERWDSYCTGKESAPGYVGGDGPDSL